MPTHIKVNWKVLFAYPGKEKLEHFPFNIWVKGLFIWRWPGLVRWAGSPRWDLSFFKKFLQNYNVLIWKVSQFVKVASYLILPGSHLGETKIFHMKTRKWSTRQGGTEFSLISFVFFVFVFFFFLFQILVKWYKNICLACMNRTFAIIFLSRLYVNRLKITWSKQPFSSNITNFLIEVR